MPPGQFLYQDKVNRAAGRRSGALFFARHQDYFIMTRNFTAIYRDWQKTRHRDPSLPLRAGSDGT
jgi:hypothetical protein